MVCTIRAGCATPYLQKSTLVPFQLYRVAVSPLPQMYELERQYLS
jgi:hypothetical protein